MNTRPKGYHYSDEKLADMKAQRDAWLAAHAPIDRRARTSQLGDPHESVQALAKRVGLRVVDGKVG